LILAFENEIARHRHDEFLQLILRRWSGWALPARPIAALLVLSSGRRSEFVSVHGMYSGRGRLPADFRKTVLCYR